MELILSNLFSAALGWAGNWWFSRKGKENHQELLKRFNFVDTQLARRGEKLKDQRNEAGELVGVQIVKIPPPSADSGAKVLSPTVITEQRSPEPPEA